MLLNFTHFSFLFFFPSPHPVFSSSSPQLIENCVCLLRNLSYHVHSEIPGADRYKETPPINQGPASSSQKGGCFSSRKGKGRCGRAGWSHVVCLFIRFQERLGRF